MILITGTVVVTAEKRAAFLKAAESHVSLSRKEPGCIAHGCHEDTMAPGTFVFLEKWKDQAAVNEHFAKDYSRAFVTEIATLASNAPQIEIHEIAVTRAVTPGR
jgi:quinol monooxygenase YgiN